MGVVLTNRQYARAGNRLDLRDALALLRRCAAGGATFADLMTATGRSRASTLRMLAALEEHLDVRIAYVPGDDHPQQGGHYRVEDWGMLRRQRVLAGERPRNLSSPQS